MPLYTGCQEDCHRLLERLAEAAAMCDLRKRFPVLFTFADRFSWVSERDDRKNVPSFGMPRSGFTSSRPMNPTQFDPIPSDHAVIIID